MIDLDQKKLTLTLSVFLRIVIIGVIVGAVLLMPELARIGNDIFGDALGLKMQPSSRSFYPSAYWYCLHSLRVMVYSAKSNFYSLVMSVCLLLIGY